MIYSSRSKVETFQECPRRGYINYLWDGRGLQKRAASVYLSTGTYTHKIEFLLKWCRANNNKVPPEEIVDEVVHLAVTSYWKEITSRGFDLEEGENKENEKFIIAEQCALVEAFIRSFASRVLPDILSRFRIVDVEREEVVDISSLNSSTYNRNGDCNIPDASLSSATISKVDLREGVILQARIDATLEEIETNDLYIVSFKTAANWDRRQEKSNEHDNQGLSETWVLEHRLRNENVRLLALTAGLDEEIALRGIDSKVRLATEKYNQYVRKFLKNEKVMGVIMIYMLKGKRLESSTHPGRWEQHSPLIRAYRKLQGTDYEYAPHLFYDNPANKSGKGRLGKGWESFNVWECEEVGGVKEWIQMLVDGKVSGDPIGEAFKIPGAYFRNQEHLDSWFRQHTNIEEEIGYKNNKLMLDFSERCVEGLDITFPQARKHCHYPTDCQFLSICYNNEIFQDPIGSGEYVYRTPHHSTELKEHERLYNIKTKKEAEVIEITNRKEVRGGEKERGEEIIEEGEEVIVE